MKHLGSTIVIQIAIVLFLIMFGLGFYGINAQRRNYTHLFEKKEASTMASLSQILEDLVFDLEHEKIINVLQSYLSDDDVLSIKIVENGTPSYFWGKIVDSLEVTDFLEKTISAPSYPVSIMYSHELIYNAQSLGTLEVTFSRHVVQQQIQVLLTSIIIIFLAIAIIESIVVSTLIHQQVVTPLSRLTKIAKQLSEGNIDVNVPKKRPHNEIGVLMTAFETMIMSTAHMAQIATAISSGDIEQHVQPRSEHDVLGQAFLDMTNYLNAIANTAKAFSIGDLRGTIAPRSPHDTLGKAFQQITGLRQIISQILTGTEKLDTVSKELAHISTQMTTGATQAAGQTEKAAESSQHIDENMVQISTGTTELASSIEEIARSADDVTQVINTAVQTTNRAEETILALEQHSQEINQIIKIITSVTQQTNLLALNATIEAARAGDVGRGFAVVAHEIKELARETAQSADDIIHKVEVIQDNSREGSAAITQVAHIMKKVQELSITIAAAVEEQTSTTTGIARLIQETSHSVNTITEMTTDVAQVARQFSEFTGIVDRSAQELAGIAAQLHQLVRNFQI